MCVFLLNFKFYPYKIEGGVVLKIKNSEFNNRILLNRIQY